MNKTPPPPAAKPAAPPGGDPQSGPTSHTMLHELHRRAEARLRKLKQPAPPGPLPAGAEGDPRRLFHELQVHQVELELQNAELLEARGRMESLLDKYTGVYDFAPAGYFTLAPDGTIMMVNLTGARLVGVARSRLAGLPFSLLLAPPDRAGFAAFLQQVFTRPGKQAGDFALLDQGQPSRSVNIEAQRGNDGRECSAVVVDITDRKQVEDQVRVSEIRYRRLFEAAHDGVLLLDPATRQITDANPFMTRLLGYPRDELVGKELFEIGLLKDEAASQEMFRKLKRKHQVRYEDLPLESQGGRHQEVEVVANLYQESGRPVIQCNIRDITERKNAEELLRRNEALFTALVTQVPVGVYVVDSALRLRQVNPRAQPVFKKVRPLLGRDFVEVLRLVWPRPAADRILARFRHTLRTGQPYQALDFTERRRDTGAKEFYEWQIQRVTLPAGEHGVVCFFNNITERVLAEGAQRRLDVLTASNRKLELEIVRRQAVEAALKESESHQRRLLARSRQMHEQLRQLSHQILRTQEEERKRISRELHDVIAQTLTGINIRLATLKIEAGHNTKGLDRNILRTQRLVEKSVRIVHRFARELRPAVLDDLGLIPALHSLLKNFTAQTGVRATLKVFAGVEELDAMRRTVLFRVTQEALTNVAKHARASRVAVSIVQQPAGICLAVKDDGQAFDVERVVNANRGKRLGLLGMRERLEMVGGTFNIVSAPGHGTTVEALLLPPPPPARSEAKATRPAKNKAEIT